MHPPFFIVDHKIDIPVDQPGFARQVRRRSQPERLTFVAASTGWPPAPLLPENPAASPKHRLSVGPNRAALPQIWLVPPPKRGLRHTVGRWLIRLGQRLILENAPGN